MSNNYPIQQYFDMIGVAGTPVTLTATNTDNLFSTRAIEGMNELVLDCAYTPGDNNRNARIYVEFSTDAVSWFREVEAESAAGTGDITTYPTRYLIPGAASGTTYKREIPIRIANQFVRILVDEDGAANFGTLHVRGIVSGK